MTAPNGIWGTVLSDSQVNPIYINSVEEKNIAMGVADIRAILIRAVPKRAQTELYKIGKEYFIAKLFYDSILVLMADPVKISVRYPNHLPSQNRVASEKFPLRVERIVDGKVQSHEIPIYGPVVCVKMNIEDDSDGYPTSLEPQELFDVLKKIKNAQDRKDLFEQIFIDAWAQK